LWHSVSMSLCVARVAHLHHTSDGATRLDLRQATGSKAVAFREVAGLNGEQLLDRCEVRRD